MAILTASPPTEKSRADPFLLSAGGILLAAGAVALGLMAASKLAGIVLPGCGAGSDCDKAARSAWGTVPGIDWPVSFIGAAYFAAMLVGWVKLRGVASPAMRWTARLAAAASLLFIGVMLYEHIFCRYCLAGHACNLLFLPVCEAAAGRAPRRLSAWRGMPVVAAVFAAASAGLGIAESQLTHNARDEYERSVQQMVNNAKKGRDGATGATAATSAPAATNATTSQPVVSSTTQPAGFTGRYLIGPARAPIRIVMITDYQCPDCKQQETIIRGILAQRRDVSLSIKHFPFCTDCNKTPALVNMHPNACWAARAAETAGLLYGPAGFQKMHEWLFDRGGGFTDEVLNAGLAQLGFERSRFVSVMQSEQALRGVLTDIDEGVRLGIQRTPMIFINGLELKNWNTEPDALSKAVQRLADSNPPSGGPEEDKPPPAGDKYVADWREQVAMAWPSRNQPWSSADPGAPVKIQIFGDFMEPNTAAADKTVRDAVAGRADIRYEFRYFPVDQSCNAGAPRTLFPYGCRAARAAEAAGQLGGMDAYWAMHEWLMSHQADVARGGDAAIRAGAASVRLDTAALLKKMDEADVAKIVADDANYGYRIGIPEIPRIFVNGKLVPRWNLPGGFVLERIIEEATANAGRNIH